MSTEDSLPNFFSILGLDPSAPWDQAAFHRTLDEKRSHWSSQRSGVKTNPATVEARRNLALVRKIEGVMLDPQSREKQRAAALKERKDELRQQHDHFASRLDLMLAKGFLYDVEYEALRVEEDVLADNPALRKKLEAAEKRPFQQAREDNERLDQATERNLRANLAILDEPDLYAVLRTVDADISETAPREQLRAAAGELYRKARNKADKNRPEVGAMQVLAGIAQKIFGSDEQMRRHNFSMLLAPLDGILDQYERALAPVRAVDSRQFERFLREAAAKGVDIALAKDVFVGYFRERNWSVDPPHASAEAWLKSQVPCPRCAVLNEPGADFCISCGAPLKMVCPRCHGRISVTARACPKCGFPAGQRDWAEYLAEETEACLDRGDLAAADLLRQAEAAWPVEPGGDDPLAARLKLAREKLGNLREEQQVTIDQVAALMDDRSYRAARRLLRSHTIRHPSASRWLAECEAAVQAADQLCRDAVRPGVPNERKAVLYLEALACCGDCREAEQQLSRIPPSPPRRLRVNTDTEHRVVQLVWDPAPDPGCSSVIVRAEGVEPPASPSGQPRYVVRGGGTWVDPEPLIGIPMSYAVYTERDIGATVSETAAVTREPVLVTTAVLALQARPGDHEVELTWKLPENAIGVDIQREESPSGANSFMLEAPEPGSSRKTDRNVRNGIRYRYTVRAVFLYPAPGGQQSKRRSRGEFCEVTPTPRPSAPGPVRARGYPPPPQIGLYRHKVELRWPQESRGGVKVVRTLPPAPPPTVGEEFPEGELSRYGLVIDPQDPTDIWFQDNLRLCYYTPVLILDGRCYAGEARRYAAGPDVDDLRAEYAGTSVYVTWGWPDGVDKVLVAWDEQEELHDPVAARLQDFVGRRDNERVGAYDIPVRAARQLFVRVAVVVRDRGTEFISSGVGTSVRQQAVSLRYEVRRGLPGRKGQLLLRPERTARLPALVLHGRSDDRPASRDDPLLKRIPPGEAGPEFGVPLQLEKSIKPHSCRLFVEDSTDEGTIRIIHPE
jgi:hypothetical protein